MSDQLSSLSLLLATLAVVYSLWYPEFTNATSLAVQVHIIDNKSNYKKAKNILWQKAIPLSIATIGVAAVFTPKAISICVDTIEEFLNNGITTISEYDAVEMALVLAVLFSMGLCAHVVHLTVQLAKQVSKLNPQRK
ncbi:MAG: hypothetical protein WC901_04995 [Candidatus Margulisiibacteriota bacterium]